MSRGCGNCPHAGLAEPTDRRAVHNEATGGPACIPGWVSQDQKEDGLRAGLTGGFKSSSAIGRPWFEDGHGAAGLVEEFVAGIDAEHFIDCTEQVFGTQGAIDRAPRPCGWSRR